MSRRLRKTAGTAVVILGLAFMAAGAAAQEQRAIPPESPVPAKDIFDVIREWRHKPPKQPENRIPGEPGKPMFSFIPYIGANSSNGFIVGASGNIAFYRGDPATTRLSTGLASVSLTSKGQVLVSAKLAVYTRNNTWFIDGDNRFNFTSQDTYGLGTNTPPSAEVDTKYNLVRIYETLYRRVFPGFSLGAGLYLNSHSDVRPSEAADPTWDQSPFVTYSEQYGFNLSTQTSAGTGVSAMFDDRDSPIDPSRGWYASAKYRFFFKGFLGGESSWEELECDLRTYFRLSRDSRHRIAFWLYGDFVTQGTAPYYGLPATAMDTYGRNGRGYLQGRYRGERLAYGEIEYRWTITRNGLFGLVAFLNTETLSNKQTGEKLFDAFAPGAGIGFRLRMNKHSKTNICFDLGWGNQGSSGFYVGIQEAF
jgi:hypothetical protein